MAKRRRNWDWPRISGGFVLLFAPARADARFARTKGDYVRMLLQCLLGIAALLLPRVLHALSGAMLGALGFSVLTFLNKADPREHEPGVCGAVHALFRPGAGRAVPDQHAEIRPGRRGGADRPGGSAGHHGGPDRGLHRGAGHRHRGLPLPQAREGEQEQKAGAPQEEGAGSLPAPSSCFALSAPASCARAPR